MYIHLEGGDTPRLVNCTFANNSVSGSASAAGGGAYFFILNGDFPFPTVTNCVFWDNTAPNDTSEDAQLKYNPPVTDFENSPATFSCIMDEEVGGDLPYYSATYDNANIDSDPLFLDTDGFDDTVGTLDDLLHLPASSPCIDSGDTSVVSLIMEDLDGFPRIVDGDGDQNEDVDMEVYEFHINVCVNDAPCVDDGALCTLEECVAPYCGKEILYGDINRSGIVNVDDAICVLDDFAGNPNSPACASPIDGGYVSRESKDIDPCTTVGDPDNMGDGFVVVTDALAALDVFACNCSNPNFPACSGCGLDGPCPQCFGPSPQAKTGGRGPSAAGEMALISFAPGSTSLADAGLIEIDVYVNRVAGLRAYQLPLRVASGSFSDAHVIDAYVDTGRTDYVFRGSESLTAGNPRRGALAAVIVGGSASAVIPKYVGTYVVRVSGAESVGAIEVDLNADDQVLLLDEQSQEIPTQDSATSIDIN